MNDPIFIVGPHRVGSTVWHNLVSMCPGVLRLGEPWFIGPPRYEDFRFFLENEIGDLSKDDEVDRMVQLSLSKSKPRGLDHKFWRFDDLDSDQLERLVSPIAERIKATDRTLPHIVRAYLDEVLLQSGKKRICMKFPADVVNIPEMIEWYPNCRIMHLTRDPRGTAMSKSNDPSGTALKVVQHPRLAWPIKKAATLFVIREYNRLSKLHTRFKSLRNYQLFQYEDLLANPEETAKSICNFIGETYSPAMLELEKGDHEHQPSSLTGERQKRLNPQAATRWKSKIPRLDSWLINNFAAKSMERFNFDPSNHPIFSLTKESQSAS